MRAPVAELVGRRDADRVAVTLAREQLQPVIGGLRSLSPLEGPRGRAAPPSDRRGAAATDRDGRLLRSLSTTSINKTLTAILELAFEYELVTRNVAMGRCRRPPVATPRRSCIDRADHTALLDAAGRLDAVAVKRLSQRRALLATLVFAGLRISEALALRWRDVDLARGEIVVRASKTDAGIRRVRILPVLRDELLSLRARLDRRSRRRWSSRPRRAAARASATSAAAYC